MTTKQRRQPATTARSDTGNAGRAVVAMITGANSGVGFGIARRLLLAHARGESIDRRGRTTTTTSGGSDPAIGSLTVVLACRNKSRAESARSSLLSEFPGADVQVLLVDVSDRGSVFRAAAEARARFAGGITHLFCNAGIMPTSGLNWTGIARSVVTNPYELLTSGSGAFYQPVGTRDAHGRGAVFMANVAGHYMLVRELEPVLRAAGNARVVFASSWTASPKYFCPDDVQGVYSAFPYQSSKYAVDLITLALEKRYAGSGIRFFSTCPGTVYTSVIQIPLPSAFMLAFYTFFRFFFISALTINAYNGAASALYTALRPDRDLDGGKFKYVSRASPLGTAYVERHPLAPADSTTTDEMRDPRIMAGLVEATCIRLMTEEERRV
ncbi:3-keto-steroid reductase [Blastocladiella emersonii ATCC 22665]|nr:3-keto-steroid reductase [Blastocladiella emersonii ATCC 22665]